MNYIKDTIWLWKNEPGFRFYSTLFVVILGFAIWFFITVGGLGGAIVVLVAAIIGGKLKGKKI